MGGRGQDGVGAWGQVGGGYTDAGKFEDMGKWNQDSKDYSNEWGQGEAEAAYKGMTPEEKAQWASMVDKGGSNLDRAHFVAGIRQRSGQGRVPVGDSLAKTMGMPWLTQGGSAPQSQQSGQQPQSPGAPRPKIDEYMSAATPNVSGPFGGTSWSEDENHNWTANTTLNGKLGGAADSLQSQYADLLKNPANTGESARNQAINAAYGQATSRLDPQWDKREAAQKTQLLNQGLDPTSQAGQSAMQDFGNQRNDAYTSAMNSAILQGDQAGNDVFKNDLAGRNSYLQQMGGLQGLAQNQMPTGLLNALIARKNNELGYASNLQQSQAEALKAGTAIAGSVMNYIP